MTIKKIYAAIKYLLTPRHVDFYQTETTEEQMKALAKAIVASEKILG